MNDVEMILRDQELDRYQENCKHEIVVFTEYSHCYGGYDDNLYQKCLFCGDESATRQSFYRSSCIDVSRSKSMECFSRREKFEIVKRLYIKTAIENPNLCREQIQGLVEAEIAKPTNVFWKIASDVI